MYPPDHGLLIARLVPGGPAERAGLRGPLIKTEQRRQGILVYQVQTVDRAAADRIVAVDGRPIKTADDFLDAIEVKQPGDQVLITVIRGGRQRANPAPAGSGGVKERPHG